MTDKDHLLDRTIREVTTSEVILDQDSFKEVYWNPCEDDDDRRQVGLVVARGSEAVATLREAMHMLRDDDSVCRKVEIVTEGVPRVGKFTDNPDLPSGDLSHQRNEDLDVVLSCVSDMVRTYPGSSDEQVAMRTCQATCAFPEEVMGRSLGALLQLMENNDCIQLENVAAFLTRKKRVSWFLKQLVGYMELLPPIA